MSCQTAIKYHNNLISKLRKQAKDGKVCSEYANRQISAIEAQINNLSK